MRYLLGFMCVWALGMVPLTGCSDPTGDGGTDGTGGTSGDCSRTGVTCNCNIPTRGACNRVHVSNFNNQPGIRVVLTAGLQECTIDQLIVTDPGGQGIELDQCVMSIAVGEDVLIGASAGIVGTDGAVCVVDDTASVPGLEPELQTFASIVAQPLSVTCDTGFTMQLP